MRSRILAVVLMLAVVLVSFGASPYDLLSKKFIRNNALVLTPEGGLGIIQTSGDTLTRGNVVHINPSGVIIKSPISNTSSSAAVLGTFYSKRDRVTTTCVSGDEIIVVVKGVAPLLVTSQAAISTGAMIIICATDSARGMATTSDLIFQQDLIGRALTGGASSTVIEAVLK